MAQGVRIEGYRETMRALKKLEDGSDKLLKDTLRKAAEPIASDFRQRVGVYQGASTRTIGPKAVMGGVFVTQRAKKTTGTRGDFGSLQMRHLLGAVADNEDGTVEKVEAAFRLFALRHGF